MKQKHKYSTLEQVVASLEHAEVSISQGNIRPGNVRHICTNICTNWGVEAEKALLPQNYMYSYSPETLGEGVIPQPVLQDLGGSSHEILSGLPPVLSSTQSKIHDAA